MIAGSMGFGVGRLLANLDDAHDGTVLVEETRLPGAKDHLVVAGLAHRPAGLGRRSREQTRYFLEHGMFKRAA